MGTAFAQSCREPEHATPVPHDSERLRLGLTRHSSRGSACNSLLRAEHGETKRYKKARIDAHKNGYIASLTGKPCET